MVVAGRGSDYQIGPLDGNRDNRDHTYEMDNAVADEDCVADVQTAVAPVRPDLVGETGEHDKQRLVETLVMSFLFSNQWWILQRSR